MIESVVNCEWSKWQIGECSEECGGGTRVDTREVIVAASHDGAECSGLSNITEDCNLQECPGKLTHNQVVN